jgi:cobalt-zinc-cadmium efflux system outer membrane protein
MRGRFRCGWIALVLVGGSAAGCAATLGECVFTQTQTPLPSPPKLSQPAPPRLFSPPMPEPHDKQAPINSPTALLTDAAASTGLPASSPASPNPSSLVLSLEGAVDWALQNNPELATLRQQHGIAGAAIIVARTYPFNPVWEAKVRAAEGPTSAGITNRVSNEHKLLMDVEVRGQGGYRRQVAGAAMSRTDWEIAAQEVAVAVRVVRAFGAVVYRQEKLRMLEETIRLNEQAAEGVSKLAEQGKLGSADILQVNTELADARAQFGPGQAALTTARSDLRRGLGMVDEGFQVRGPLETPGRQWESAKLTQAALDLRPELHARQAALAEAEARLRLETANRFGNPNFGPAFEYDPTRVSLIGAQFTLPLPAFNTHKGEILLRQAERTRAALDLRQTEVQIRQEVRAALARLTDARSWLNTYHTKVLPTVRTSLKGMEALRAQGVVDVLRMVDMRRRQVKADDGYLDAQWELNQALADVAAAVGDPALAIGSPLPLSSFTPSLATDH